MAQPEFRKGAKVTRWERSLDRPERALKQIGALMVAESQRSFVDQRFGRKSWSPRAPVNVFGIVADFAAGRRAPPARRFQRKPALVDTGRLRGSISFRIVGNDGVEVGSNLDYAGVHQTGGEVESETITQTVQQAIARWLGGDGARHRDRLGFLLSEKLTGEKLTGKVPARPFVGITKQTMADVKLVVGRVLLEAG